MKQVKRTKLGPIFTTHHQKRWENVKPYLPDMSILRAFIPSNQKGPTDVDIYAFAIILYRLQVIGNASTHFLMHYCDSIKNTIVELKRLKKQDIKQQKKMLRLQAPKERRSYNPLDKFAPTMRGKSYKGRR